MAEIGRGLKIKYGLGQEPTHAKAQEWADLARRYIREGFSQEEAGNLAARFLFRDYQTHRYASQADTIAYLLDQIGKK